MGPPRERWRWISPCRSAEPPIAASLVTARSDGFTSISPSMTREPKPWSAEVSPDPGRFRFHVCRVSVAHRRMPPHITGDPSQGRTMATLIGFLASSGLRSGGVVRLDRSDVDLTNGVLLGRRTKFRGSSRSSSHDDPAALCRYAHERDAAFPTPRTRPFSSALVAMPLGDGPAKWLCWGPQACWLDRGKPVWPRDLRRRLTVTRLGLWHQPVHTLLPWLAAYLGQASYSDTAYYLTCSADLLAIAAERAFLDAVTASSTRSVRNIALRTFCNPQLER